MRTMEAIANFANIAGAVGGVASAIGVGRLMLANRRSMQPVTVEMRLQNEAEESDPVVLPMEMLRRDVTRAELLGRLSMCQVDPSKRFSLGALTTAELMNDINRVTKGRSSTLTIPCTESEIAQFSPTSAG